MCMSIEKFIAENRELIDDTIRSIPGARTPRDDDEREQWVANCEPLYLWALESGVDWD